MKSSPDTIVSVIKKGEDKFKDKSLEKSKTFLTNFGKTRETRLGKFVFDFQNSSRVFSDKTNCFSYRADKNTFCWLIV